MCCHLRGLWTFDVSYTWYKPFPSLACSNICVIFSFISFKQPGIWQHLDFGSASDSSMHSSMLFFLDHKKGFKCKKTRLSTKVLFIRVITYFGGSASQRHSINLAFLMEFWGISKRGRIATCINKTSVLRRFIMVEKLKIVMSHIFSRVCTNYKLQILCEYKPPLTTTFLTCN